MNINGLFEKIAQPQSKQRISIKDYKIKNRNIFDNYSTELYEANHPTLLHIMFRDFLELIPKETLESCETKLLFEEALIDIIGKKEAKTKNKKYI